MFSLSGICLLTSLDDPENAVNDLSNDSQFAFIIHLKSQPALKL